ncbi:MAG: hypothetical protein ABH858_01405 [Candidatus Omnitrophota bacterium]
MAIFQQTRRKEKATVLILSVWALIFLSTLAIILGSVVSKEISLVRRVETRNKIYDLLYSGVMAGQDIIISCQEKDETPAVDSLNDFWADQPGLFKDIKVDKGRVSIYYNYKNNITKKEDLRYGFVDEERKININYASRETLKCLFSLLLDEEKAPLLAAAIEDWRDQDDILYSNDAALSERINYANSGYEYAPKNAPFRSLEELLLVKDVDAETFFNLRDYITVFGDGKVNINTAPLEVIISLGMTGSLADKIVYFRCGPDRIEGSWDDNYFTSLDTVIDDLSLSNDISDEDKENFNQALSAGSLDVKSSTFTAICEGRLADSSLTGKIMCVFDKQGNTRYWSCKLTNISGLGQYD